MASLSVPLDPSTESAWLLGSLTADLLLLGVALLTSAFFSSTETALTALSEHRARTLIEANPRKNRALALWLERPNQVLTTILIGNNVVNTFTASVATLVAQNVFSNSALSIAVGLTTIAILVVGEITPKTFAKHNAERLAPLSMRIIGLLRLVLIWMVIPFTMMSKGLVKIFGGQLTRTGPFVTEEDLAYFVKIAQQEGVIEEHEGELVASALDFGDTVVREIMIPRTDISAIKEKANLEQVLTEVKESGHTRMPVYGENVDDIRGIFHTKELLKQLDGNVDAATFTVAKYMHKPYFVPELMKIAELLKEFQRRRMHMAVVVDEYGGTSGIVCLEDIIDEIVGEIKDEYDDEPDDIKRIDDNRFIADGKASIHDLGEILSVDFPEDSAYESLGGFLISQHGRMPQMGDRLSYGGWLFVVTDAGVRRVARVEVMRLSPDQSGAFISVPSSGEHRSGPQPVARGGKKTSGPMPAAVGEPAVPETKESIH